MYQTSSQRFLGLSLLALALSACAGPPVEEMSPSQLADEIAAEEESIGSTEQGLKKGAYSGGTSLLFGNTPYGDCLTDCSHQKAACERANSDRGHDDLMRPCDLEYSICRADCRSAFPQ